MKQLFSIFLVFSLLACKNKTEKTFVLPSDDEINSIVEAVIYQDSLPVLKDSTLFQRYRKNTDKLSVDLRKIKLIFPDKTLKIQPPPPPNSLSVSDLLNLMLNGNRFFNKNDSLGIVYQNEHIKSFIIDERISIKVLATTYVEERKKRETLNNIQYYDLSIPIFSTDRKRAYVEVNFNCSGLCGGGEAIYLEKINNKWKIVDKKMTWIS